MACAADCVTRVSPALLDGELGRFFHALPAAHCDGIRLRTGRSGCACRWISLLPARSGQANQMGAHPPPGGVVTLHGSDNWTVSMELSVVTVLPPDPGDLRCRSATLAAEVPIPGYSSAW